GGRFVTRRLWRAVAVVVLSVGVVLPLVVKSARVHEMVLDALRPAALMQIGHVNTRGHAYALLEGRFYEGRTQENQIGTMTWPEGLSYVARALVSVVVFPAPTEMRSDIELMFLPEQIVWYVMLLTIPIGVVAGLRRDALVTSLFLAYGAIALLAVALTTGNMGTLVRHRAFGVPYLMALSALGTTVLVRRFCDRLQ
ncbi:MAG: hypothetical protein ACHQO8_14015, partial [Vicinamibacterales bacterium]